MNQEVRIIGGQFRGKKLSFPSASGLRPTPNRVRETLFNWLMQPIIDSCCLDAFAGSGALGFEAFSRGSKQVVLLEKNPVVYANLCTIAHSFHTDALIVKHESALTYLQNTTDTFDIIFLDPPFAISDLTPHLDCLTHSDVLKQNGLLYLELPRAIPLSPIYWQTLKQKKAGQVVYALHKKTSEFHPKA